MPIINLHEKFDSLSGQKQEISVRYSKDTKTTKIMRFFKENGSLFVEHQKYVDSDRTITQKATLITDESLQNEHQYISTLFDATHRPTPEVKKTWKENFQEFKKSRSKIKFLTRYFLLDTKLVGGPVGKIIAYSANKGQSHYKTYPSQILAKTLGPIIFPGGSKKPRFDEETGIVEIDSILHKQYKALRNYSSDYSSLSGKELKFRSKDVTVELRGQSCKLETVETDNHHLVKDSPKTPIHIIYFNGNSGCFQQDYKNHAGEHLARLAEKGQPATAVHFNYPGVLNSEGQVEVADDLVQSGIAQLQDLLDRGVKAENIALHGVSLGGSISSHVAAHFHKKGQTLGALYASRTFASTAQVGRAFFNKALGNNFFSKLISTACLPFIKLGTWGSEWDLDTGKAFFSIPRNKRAYSVVISSKATRKRYQKHQGTLPLDDAILGRGLHDSWEKALESLKIKLGFYGPEAKKAYSEENRARKMRVYDFNTNATQVHIDGHAAANYAAKSGDKLARADKKPTAKKVSVGLLHRHAWTREEEQLDPSKLHSHEASEVFLTSILQMIKSPN